MKNKTTTYILVVAVALVWGLIFYRVFDGLESDTPALSSVNKIVALPEESEDVSFDLLANYRDPFLGKRYTVSSKKPVLQKKKKVVHQVIKKSNVQIAFLGLISNESKKKKVGIIRYKNRETSVEEGQQLDGIQIIRLVKDSVLVAHAQGKQWFK